MFNSVKSIINSERGKIIFSILLGFGLATLFRKSCKSNNCLVYKAPSLSNINGQIFQHNNKCYKFNEKNVSCSKTDKKILEIE